MALPLFYLESVLLFIVDSVYGRWKRQPFFSSYCLFHKMNNQFIGRRVLRFQIKKKYFGLLQSYSIVHQSSELISTRRHQHQWQIWRRATLSIAHDQLSRLEKIVSISHDVDRLFCPYADGHNFYLFIFKTTCFSGFKGVYNLQYS